MPTGMPMPAPRARLWDWAGWAFAVAEALDGWTGGVAVVGEGWELDGGVERDDEEEEEADEGVEVACGDDGVVEGVEDGEEVDDVGDDVDDDPAPDDVETALTTVMVE